MNKTLKNALTIVVSLVIASVLMYLAVGGMDLNKIKQVFIRADYTWIFVAAVFGLLAYWIRAVRWNLLLEPMNFKISNWNALWSLSFGYFMNLGIPRSGEVARATILQRTENVPVEKSFGTIVTERIVDLIFMVLFLLLTVLFKYNEIFSFYKLISEPKKNKEFEPNFLESLLMRIGILDFNLFYFYVKIVFVIILISVIVYFYFFNRVKLINFGKGVLQGLTSIFKLKRKVEFILLSFGIWICYYFAAYFVVFALPETSFLTLKDGFFLVSIGTLGMLVPASGGIGAFHAALKIGFAALFLSLGKSQIEGEEVGLSYAFLSHTLQMVIMIVMGIVSIPFIFRKQNLKIK